VRCNNHDVTLAHANISRNRIGPTNLAVCHSTHGVRNWAKSDPTSQAMFPRHSRREVREKVHRGIARPGRWQPPASRGPSKSDAAWRARSPLQVGTVVKPVNHPHHFARRTSLDGARAKCRAGTSSACAKSMRFSNIFREQRAVNIRTAAKRRRYLGRLGSRGTRRIGRNPAWGGGSAETTTPTENSRR
jgi:hypothetical protein